MVSPMTSKKSHLSGMIVGLIFFPLFLANLWVILVAFAIMQYDLFADADLAIWPFISLPFTLFLGVFVPLRTIKNYRTLKKMP